MCTVLIFIQCEYGTNSPDLHVNIRTQGAGSMPGRDVCAGFHREISLLSCQPFLTQSLLFPTALGSYNTCQYTRVLLRAEAVVSQQLGAIAAVSGASTLSRIQYLMPYLNGPISCFIQDPTVRTGNKVAEAKRGLNARV